MTGLEVTLLVIGLIVIAASFIFSNKADGEEVNAGKSVEFTEKQKEDIRKQVMNILDDEIEEVKDKTEVALDKLSNQKMLEMNEYSDTILGEINRNHNEVMFLYDMLNEKKKEINITVRDMNIAKKEIENTVKSADEPVKNTKKKDIMQEIADMNEDVGGFMASEEILKEEKKFTGSKKNASILDQLDAVVEAVSDDTPADEDAVVKKTRKKTATGKTAAKRVKDAVVKESLRENTAGRDPKSLETGNNNERILELASKGKSNVEIAKELGLGIGEVKLVIDLFKGGR